MTTDATATGNGGAAGDPAAGAGGAASQPAAAAHWLAAADWTDDDRAYASNKGWDKLPTAIPKPVFESYRNLEKVMGGKANAVLLPKAGDDPKVVNEFFQKLGKPMEAKEYKLPEALAAPEVAQNLNKDLISAYQGWALDANLTNEQFGKLVEKHEAFVAEVEEKAVTAYNGEVSRTKAKLEQEFGDQFGEMVARGNLARNQLGLKDEGKYHAFCEAIGVEAATRMLMQVGGMMAQHKAVGLNNGGKQPDSFVTDKARAISRIQAIKMLQSNATGPDADFKKAMLDPGHPEHKNTSAQWREWNRIAGSKG